MKSFRFWRATHRLGASEADQIGKELPHDFNPHTYLTLNPDVAAAGVDAVQHYLATGRVEGRGYTSGADELNKSLPEDFNAEVYLLFNPDVAASGLEPEQHFVAHARKENRLYKLPSALDISRFDLDKPTCIIVSHEASLTGAPVLSLNIAKSLAEEYNIITILLGRGGLERLFEHISSWSVCGDNLRINYNSIDIIISEILLNEIKVDFAIVNSIESRYSIPFFSKHNIPVVTLIHEFAAYTRPIDAFHLAFLWSHQSVFSTALTYENAIQQHPDLCHTPVNILPQGRCAVPQIDHSDSYPNQNVGKLVSLIRTHIKPSENEILILGAGTVQYRKGVDLFLQVASIFARQSGLENCRFVWIGKGYDPDKDMTYSAYLREQINRADLRRIVTLLPESNEIEELYEEADICFLSSRLDPLPNIAIDALVRSIPLVCFDSASGISEILKQYDLGEDCVAEYLLVEDAAEKIKRLVVSAELRKAVGRKGRLIAEKVFDWDNYVNELKTVVGAAKIQAARERRDIEIISNSDTFDFSYYEGCSQPHSSGEQTLRRYVRSWATYVSPRKPRPGFHPGIYSELRGLRPEDGDPFAHYIASGMPQGDWDNIVIKTQSQIGTPLTKIPRLALHVHAFYTDFLVEIVERIGRNSARPDLFISVPSDQAKSRAHEAVSLYCGGSVDIRITPNVGRDIGPMITEFGRELAESYEFIGHVHSKKSDNFDSDVLGETWRNFLYENLLGGQHAGPALDHVLQAMNQNQNISMVFPDDPFEVGWQSNLEIAKTLAAKFGLEKLPKHFLFPVGTMFWSKVDCIEPLLRSGLDWKDYPAEPLAYDGTQLHALERIIGLMGYRLPNSAPATIHTPGVFR